jgi:hypothetical protein
VVDACGVFMLPGGEAGDVGDAGGVVVACCYDYVVEGLGMVMSVGWEEGGVWWGMIVPL